MGGNSDVELVKSDGRRLDGRKLDELRPIKIQAGVLERADGSAYVEWGNNKVYAAVYGPREVHPRHDQSATRAIVRCRYSMAPFSVDDRKRPGPDRRSQEISKVISEAFTGVVFTDQFPRTAIDVFMEVVEADAGTRCAAMTAASVALADAGIPMRDLVVAVASGKINGKVALDLNKPEDNFGEADCPMGIIPSSGEIVLLQMDGHLTSAEWEQALEYNMGAAKQIYEMQKEALRDRWARAAEAEGEPEVFVEPPREEVAGFSGSGGGGGRGFGGGGGAGRDRGFGGGGRDRGYGGGGGRDRGYGGGGGRDRGRDRGFGGGGGRDRGRDRGFGGGGAGRDRDRGYGGGGRDRGYGGGGRDRGYGGGRDRGFGGGRERDREGDRPREGAPQEGADRPEGGHRQEGGERPEGGDRPEGGGFQRRERSDRMDEFADRDRMSSGGRGRRRRSGSGGGGFRSSRPREGEGNEGGSQ